MEGALKLREVVDREAIEGGRLSQYTDLTQPPVHEDESFCSKAEDTDTALFPELRRKQKSSVMLCGRGLLSRIQTYLRNMLLWVPHFATRPNPN